MDLNTALAGVRDLAYDPEAGAGQPAQQHLREARGWLPTILPPIGLRVRVSGAAQNLPRIPWVGVLNPEVTSTAQSGLYVVYLYDAHLERVYLTMNQGATAHRRVAQSAERAGMTINEYALGALRRESAILRGELPGSLIDGTDSLIDLSAEGFLPEAYEAGTIAALPYELASLPPPAAMQEQLMRFLAIYDATVDAKKRLTAEDPGSFPTPATDTPSPKGESSELFRPKDASDYVATIAAHTQVRTRRHEAVVRAFGTHVKGHGWTPVTTVHPRDLVLRRDGAGELLCEVKVVKANATGAVREVIGQLFTYRAFLYAHDAPPAGLVAVFSEHVGDAFVTLLSSLGIMSVWPVGGAWFGSVEAQAAQLVQTPAT